MVTHRDAIAAIAAVHGLEIEHEWTGEYGRSREFAIGVGQPDDALELCCSHLRQRHVGAAVRLVTNPESPHLGGTFLHVSVPK